MKLLLLTGQVYPQCGNNANLIGKIISVLAKEHEIHILSPAYGVSEADLPKEMFSAKLHSLTRVQPNLKNKLIRPIISKLIDRNGFSDYVQAMRIYDKALALHKTEHFDAIISTSEPYASAYASSKIKGIKRALYLMDPPECVSDRAGTPFRSKNLKFILDKQDRIVTTPFIKKALIDSGYKISDKAISLGFPMICDNEIEKENTIAFDKSKINLLFCGWLYSEIRSPKYFLNLVNKLDERFCVCFMGKECELLNERFDIDTKAQIITLPQQPYSVALSAMEQADILINIGNSVPVHMPSKTLEYINTGKPFVNFYKFEDCPTLYYSKRYPLCLNLYEGNENIDDAFNSFLEFCEDKAQARLDRENIKEEFSDCTPEYIAEKIIEGLGK